MHLISSAEQPSVSYRKVYTMDLFLLPKDVRCRIVCILLGAVKVDKDAKEVSFLLTYNKTEKLRRLKNCCNNSYIETLSWYLVDVLWSKIWSSMTS